MASAKKFGDFYFQDGDFQFSSFYQNEIDACTQGLPIVGVGDTSKIKNTFETAYKTLVEFEQRSKK